VATTDTDQQTTPTPLTVGVLNGNLRFVAQPVLLGHYGAMKLTGTERLMDTLIGGGMSQSLAIGEYPEPPGTYQVFINRAARSNPFQMPRPEAVVVVGLGDEGKLNASELADTVRGGVIAWAVRRADAGDEGPFQIAATLIGSGGTGMSAGQSALCVARGVRDANERLGRSGRRGVSRLTLVELYLDRAGEAWRALREQTSGTPQQFTLGEVIESGVGALRRPLEGGYRGAGYDLLSVLTERDAAGDTISYVLDTKRARAEVRAQLLQEPLLRQLVTLAASDANNDDDLGRTLFRLLVPIELEPFLAGTIEVVFQLDVGTAGIPWELLDAGSDESRFRAPWAIRSKLLRKLRTPEFREKVVQANGNAAVLVIGEPASGPSYPALPGARAEAKALRDRLTNRLPRGQVTTLVTEEADQPGPLALAVINTLMRRPWRIVHIAGHGEAPQWTQNPPQMARSRQGTPRGVVLSDDAFLGPAEIAKLRPVPDLVFINCCHLAAHNPEQLLARQGDARLSYAWRAATLADALIQIGVRCVIAAGWAIEDEAALAFATTFYDGLLDGKRFMDAVVSAREAARAKGGNTWAAYQCYGDPDWTFQHRPEDGAEDALSPAEMFRNVASSVGVILALEGLAVSSTYDRSEQAKLPERIGYLEERFAGRWGDLGQVAEAFGLAWAECDRARAISWYSRALSANDGGASLRAAEQLGNLRARTAWELVADLAADGGAGVRSPDVDQARAEIDAAIALLDKVAAIQPTVERESLCGSAWKRKALLETLAHRPEAERKAIAAMKAHYAAAEGLAREIRHPELFYPALNCMAAELILEVGAGERPEFDPGRLAAVRVSLEAKTRSDPDFWSVTGLIELQVYEAVAAGRLADAFPTLDGAYVDVQQRVTAARQWASTRDQLRFVLSKCPWLSPTERQAGEKLLGRLEGFARLTTSFPTNREVQP
jgi:CHAT domain-containing protein